MDCGSQQGGRHAATRWREAVRPGDWFEREPSAICVTHYHTDHYNGLVWAARAPSFPRLRGFDTLLHPATPTPQTRDLLRATLAFRAYVAGFQGLPMELDLWRRIARLNDVGPVARRALVQGDSLDVAGVHLEIAWPPPTLGPEVTERVQDALATFHDLMESPSREPLRELYRRSEEVGLEPEEVIEPTEPSVEDETSPEPELSAEDVLDADPELKKVNDRLRRAANHLSLAFVADGRVLCLGDLDGRPLAAAVEYVVAVLGMDFDVIVPPHHGTQWHPTMDKLRGGTVAVPVGGRLWEHVCPELGRLSGDVRFSRVVGDVWL